ncbi:MAG: hypothetical protein ACR2ND_11150 [Solirubrobacteraceae bacterium]
MNEFTYIVVGGLALLAVVLFAIGRYYPGSGADVIDWQPTRSYETEMELELEDIGQMLEAQNERRRRRGERERTQDDVELQVAGDLADQQARAAAYRSRASAEDEDLEQLLEMSNARRRRRGEPELTLEQYRAQLGA